jgi:hypothetical protein
MPLSRRYTPEHGPGDACSFGLDYSFVIPPGVGISAVTLKIYTNTTPMNDASADWTIVSGPSILGRAVYVLMTGGVSGTDYRLIWTATDTTNNTWRRTALLLCAETS